MKKFSFLLGIIFSAILLSSCATLPKTVADGDTLIIGQIRCTLSGYDENIGAKLNGVFTKDVEITVLDVNENKEYFYRPDKDGYIFMTNLPPHHACCISKVKVTARAYSGNGGWSVGLDIQPEQRKILIPWDNKVVNMGCLDFYFDGKRNWVNWEYSNHSAVNVHFKQLSDNSEWMMKEVYDQ